MSRPERRKPKDFGDGWPDAVIEDPIGETARRFAANLRAAMGADSLRAAAARCDVSHATLLAILAGTSWPDLETIAKLERGLGADLWPGRASV